MSTDPRCSSLMASSQENKSDCSIFTFDVLENKSRLPLARNAVRKLRTLRHPGVIKVLDTVEVFIPWKVGGIHSSDQLADRHIHLRCHRAADSVTMACPEKSAERRDAQMGSLYHCCTPLVKHNTMQRLREGRTHWHLSMKRLSQYMVVYGLHQSSSARVENGG